MKIVDTRKKHSVKKFRDIVIGQCFLDDDGNVTIKAIDTGSLETYAVCLKDGEQWFPDDSHEFEIVSATVVIE